MTCWPAGTIPPLRWPEKPCRRSSGPPTTRASSAPLPEAVKGAVFTLQDAAETLRDFRDGLDFSDEEFDRIETRLSLLRRLERKHNTDEAGLIRHA